MEEEKATDEGSPPESPLLNIYLFSGGGGRLPPLQGSELTHPITLPLVKGGCGHGRVPRQEVN